LQGLDQTSDLVTASSLCGACEEVCPVKIPIPSLLQRLRHDAKLPAAKQAASLKGQASAASSLEHNAWRVWAWLSTHPRFYNWAMALGVKFAKYLPMPMGEWTRCRSKPELAEQTFHQKMKQRAAKQASDSVASVNKGAS
jgi:L-lactate dehydrogenase complex protein LldF